MASLSLSLSLPKKSLRVRLWNVKRFVASSNHQVLCESGGGPIVERAESLRAHPTENCFGAEFRYTSGNWFWWSVTECLSYAYTSLFKPYNIFGDMLRKNGREIPDFCVTVWSYFEDCHFWCQRKAFPPIFFLFFFLLFFLLFKLSNDAVASVRICLARYDASPPWNASSRCFGFCFFPWRRQVKRPSVYLIYKNPL